MGRRTSGKSQGRAEKSFTIAWPKEATPVI